MATFRAFLKAVLPFASAIAAITPNKIDDEAIALIQAWLDSGSTEPLHVFAKTYQPKP